ncbi:MAG TPA: hypothetical protein PKZ08_10700 [Vicinamibacterales bacterium]|nr:hypothetical protein [Vicinamibacterales bacterium]
MADNPTKWSALGTHTELIATASLKNLANGAGVLGAEVDNSVGSQYAYVELSCKGASAFSAGGYVGIWLVHAVDGTNYEDGSATGPVTPARPADIVIPVRATTAQQRQVVGPVLWPPGKFKALLVNATGQAFTNADNENTLYYRTFNDNLVTS